MSFGTEYLHKEILDLKRENKMLRDFFNEVSHAVLDLYTTVCLDNIDRVQLRDRVLTKIEVANGKAMTLLENQSSTPSKTEGDNNG